MSTVFKIMAPDGSFSTGGACPRFTKKGKVWNGLGPLKNHLRIFETLPKQYAGCVVVELELVPIEKSRKDLQAFHKDSRFAAAAERLEDKQKLLQSMLDDLPAQQAARRKELTKQLAETRQAMLNLR